MKRHERLSEKALRDNLSKKVETLSSREARELYSNLVAPISLYIDDHGYVCFDEKGLKWSMEETGWTARLEGHAIFCTNEITAPTVVQRLDAFDRAQMLQSRPALGSEQQAGNDAQVFQGVVREEDAPSSAAESPNDEEAPVAFFGRPAERKSEWSPRRELMDFVKLCSSEQLEQFTQEVLDVPYCARVGKEFLIVSEPIGSKDLPEGLSLDMQRGKRMTRASLNRELLQAADQTNMDHFAQLCSAALGKSCKYIGNGRFVVDGKEGAVTDLDPGHGMHR